MPKWLQGMFTPTLMLWLYAVAAGIATGLRSDGRLPDRARFAASVAFSLIMAWWIIADARKRQKQLCYDSFIYFAWPVVVPVYLFQTRGWRALLTLFCFAGILLV